MIKVFSKFIFFILLCCSVFNSKTSEAITLATSGDYEPYEFYKNGELVGIDIDLCKALEEVTYLDIKVVDTGNFDSLVSDVVNGKYDGIIAGLDPTSERKQKMSATVPYHNGFVIFMQKDSKYIDVLNSGIEELKSNGIISEIAARYK